MAGSGPADLHALEGSPDLAPDDGTNRLMRNSILSAKLRELTVFAGIALMNLRHLYRGEFGSYAASVVRSVRDRLKVFRIDTVTYTTQVIYLQSLRDRSIAKFVRDSVRLLPLESSVAASAYRSRPDPARSAVPAVNLAPEGRTPFLWIRELRTRSMADDVTDRLTFYVSKLGVRLCCERSLLTAPALTQSAGVGRLRSH